MMLADETMPFSIASIVARFTECGHAGVVGMDDHIPPLVFSRRRLEHALALNKQAATIATKPEIAWMHHSQLQN